MNQSYALVTSIVISVPTGQSAGIYTGNNAVHPIQSFSFFLYPGYPQFKRRVVKDAFHTKVLFPDFFSITITFVTNLISFFKKGQHK
jgi:hypothetical protein